MTPQNTKFNILNMAQQMCLYILNITQKMPKKYRSDIINEVRSIPFHVIRMINDINSLDIDGDNATCQTIQDRLDLHRQINVELTSLDSFLLTCYSTKPKLIAAAQFIHASKLVNDLNDSMQRWRESDKKRGDLWSKNNCTK